MTLSEYTPTTEKVRDTYVTSQFVETEPNHFDEVPPEVTGPEFDRWLKQVKAEVWDEAYLSGVEDEGCAVSGTDDAATNPYD